MEVAAIKIISTMEPTAVASVGMPREAQAMQLRQSRTELMTNHF